MKTIEFLKEVHDAKDVWFYLEDEQTKQHLEKDLGMNLEHCQNAIHFNGHTWVEVSPKLLSIYNQCGPESIFGGIVFVDYKKFLHHDSYIYKKQ